MKLLKLLTAIVIASAATFTATAQDKAYFGVRAAYDMCTSTKNSYMTSWGSGFSVGGVYFAPFGKLTFFQPGLLFYADNIRIDGTTKNEDNRHTYDGNIRTYGLRMPLDFGLKVIDNKVIGLNVYTGPHLYFNFSSKMICDDTYYGKTTHINEKLSTPGMELGWALGIGINVCKRWHIFAEGIYGLSDLGKTYRFDRIYIEDTEQSNASYLRRAEFSFGIGYNF